MNQAYLTNIPCFCGCDVHKDFVDKEDRFIRGTCFNDDHDCFLTVLTKSAASLLLTEPNEA